MDGSQRGTTQPIHSDRNLGLNLFGLPTRGQGVRIQTEEEDEAKISNIYIYAAILRVSAWECRGNSGDQMHCRDHSVSNRTEGCQRVC